MDLRLVRSSGTELTCNKSTQLHDAFIGHARQRRDLIGCSETTRRTFGARRVVNTCMHSSAAVHTGVHELQFANCSSVQTVRFRSVHVLRTNLNEKAVLRASSLSHTCV